VDEGCMNIRNSRDYELYHPTLRVYAVHISITVRTHPHGE
jgi:hypothetical protein